MQKSGMYSYSGTNAGGITAEFSYMPSDREINCALTVGRYVDDRGTETTFDETAGFPSFNESGYGGIGVPAGTDQWPSSGQ